MRLSCSCFVFAVVVGIASTSATLGQEVPEEPAKAEEPAVVPETTMTFTLRCVGWVVLGLIGAGALGAKLRGKPTGHHVVIILGFAGYRTYAAWRDGVSVIPPLICFAVVILFGGMAKTAGETHLEDDEHGWSRPKRRPGQQE